MDRPSFAKELEALRLAAERGDVNGCWDATLQLLRHLPVHRQMRLVREFVTRRLSTFERHQAEAHWPREFIESVSEAGPVGDSRIWPEAESDFPGPGANSFIAAVEALWRAGRLTEDEQRRGELLTDAIERAVSAERLEHWGARHPTEWARWYQLASEGSDDMSKYEILGAIKQDPETARVEKEAWLEVAQRLEEELNTSERK